ncbi:13197_t:CDS:2 [Entrophospora sp. SA101]|nr:13197_t:CDS:2 [Entrophospora sp. SA101]
MEIANNNRPSSKIEQSLALWIDQAASDNCTLSGHIVISKAKVFAQHFQINDFKGSNGWFVRFKRRYNISEHVRCGEANSAPLEELIDAYDNKINQQIPVPKLTIFDAISFTAEAWNLVLPSTIVSCWFKVDILPSLENIEDYLILPSDDDTDSIQEMIGCFNFDDSLSANDYIEIDLRLQNQDKLADQEIIEL